MENGSFKNRGMDDFQGLIAYQPGDSLRHIAWKAFSRGQGLYTKSFVGQSTETVSLDWALFRGADTEHKLSRLCDMVIKAHNLNLKYGLKLPGVTIEPDKGSIHKHRCLKALSLFSLPDKTT